MRQNRNSPPTVQNLMSLKITIALLACTSLIGARPLDPAQAQDVVDPQSVAALAAVPEIDPELLETLELSPHDQRMAVPVTIGDNDDYRFVIDTGAERTV
ncbi:hypothetical protein, partial [Escherichia coli]|uniref:hypothetical protein n=1 Tax=Escherichia coli TaxID=562 RepID=UPI00190CDAA2